MAFTQVHLLSWVILTEVMLWNITNKYNNLDLDMILNLLHSLFNRRDVFYWLRVLTRCLGLFVIDSCRSHLQWNMPPSSHALGSPLPTDSRLGLVTWFGQWSVSSLNASRNSESPVSRTDSLWFLGTFVPPCGWESTWREPQGPRWEPRCVSDTFLDHLASAIRLEQKRHSASAQNHGKR